MYDLSEEDAVAIPIWVLFEGVGLGDELVKLRLCVDDLYGIIHVVLIL